MILNLKKGIIELLILSLLNKRPMHTFEILRFISEKSGSVCAITHPYNIFYRLLDRGLIVESEKKMAEDCRRRQYYAITLRDEPITGRFAANMKVSFPEPVRCWHFRMKRIRRIEERNLSLTRYNRNLWNSPCFIYKYGLFHVLRKIALSFPSCLSKPCVV